MEPVKHSLPEGAQAGPTLQAKIADVLRELQQIQDGCERESLPFHANLRLRVLDASGAVTDERVLHNIICQAGKNRLLAASGGAALSAFAYVAIGTGTATPAAADTALQTETARSPQQTPANPSASVYQVQYAFGGGVGTGAITEAGLFDAASGGSLLAHQTFAAVNKGASDTLTIQWSLS